MYQLERDLVEDLTAAAPAVLQSTNSCFLTRELTLKTRVVDVALADAIDPRQVLEDWSTFAPGFRRLGAAQEALLAIIWTERRISVDRLAKQTWMDAAALRRNHIEQLARMRLVEVSRRGTVTPTAWAEWTPTTLVAIEAKLTDWRTATEQAVDHMQWADYSFVAMPGHGYLRRRDVRDELRIVGVGGLEVSPEEGITVAVRPRRCRAWSVARARVAIGLLGGIVASPHRTNWQAQTS